jgi:hypothetical protein
MHAILNLGPFLLHRSRLQPLSEEQLAFHKSVIDEELGALRVDIRSHYPEGLRQASISEATWLMDRLEVLSEPARRYLAHHPTWI